MEDPQVLKHTGVVTVTYHLFSCPVCGTGAMVLAGVVKSAGRGAVPFNISVGGTRGHACPSHVIQQPERGAAELEFPTDLAQQIEDALQEDEE